MSELLEGLALRRAVAEMQGLQFIDSEEDEYLFRIGKHNIWVDAPDIEIAWHNVVAFSCVHYETDLNTLPEAAALLPDGYKFSLVWHSGGGWVAGIVEVGTDFEGISITIQHTIPATAAWNAVLAWKRAQGE